MGAQTWPAPDGGGEGVECGDHHITDEHVADAIEFLLATRDRSPTNVDESVTS